MQWWYLLLPFGMIGYEFQRVARHLNGLKDDYRRLEEEVKELRKRVYRLEDDDE
ncbi:hypothetical protein [Pseudomonas sp. GL-B-16]|uniref:hypothetical protein n=1 Tax=Pseudomonas sp. GL-B-16 TaxID=2832373 RepID=UPI001CBBDC4B|nr:hypothetical protein [Pseudomonas sp. GL-B-16]